MRIAGWGRKEVVRQDKEGGEEGRRKESKEENGKEKGGRKEGRKEGGKGPPIRRYVLRLVVHVHSSRRAMKKCSRV